jgi:hypothetical protein
MSWTLRSKGVVSMVVAIVGLGITVGGVASAATGPPTGAPAQPAAPHATAHPESAVVTWTPPDAGSSPITSYTVTASPGGETCTLSSGPLDCTVSGLLNSTAYVFTVRAGNAIGTGRTSLPSNTVTPVGAPSKPGTPEAWADNGLATVTWTASEFSGGSPIDGYMVTSSPPSEGCTARVNNLSCIIEGLQDGVTYTFSVRGYNVIGGGALSGPSNAVVPDPALGIPGPPSAPVETDDTGHAVSWNFPMSGGGTISEFVVTASPGTQTCTDRVSGPIVCVFTNLLPGHSYTYTVRAENQFGFGPTSPASASFEYIGVPPPPRNLTATAGNGSATITWTPPSTTGGKPIVSYAVEARIPGNNSYIGPDCSWAGGSLQCTVTGLTNGDSYDFRMVDNNGIYQSAWSSYSNVVVPEPTAS